MQKEYNFFCDYYKYLTTVNKHGISNLYTLMLKSLKNILLNSLVPKAFVLINNFFFFSLRFSNILIYFETNGRGLIAISPKTIEFFRLELKKKLYYLKGLNNLSTLYLPARVGTALHTLWQYTYYAYVSNFEFSGERVLRKPIET